MIGPALETCRQMQDLRSGASELARPRCLTQLVRQVSVMLGAGHTHPHHRRQNASAHRMTRAPVEMMIPSAAFARSRRVGMRANWPAMNSRWPSIRAKSVLAWSAWCNARVCSSGMTPVMAELGYRGVKPRGWHRRRQLTPAPLALAAARYVLQRASKNIAPVQVVAIITMQIVSPGVAMEDEMRVIPPILAGFVALMGISVQAAPNPNRDNWLPLSAPLSFSLGDQACGDGWRQALWRDWRGARGAGAWVRPR